jgi:hypothetical protein
MAIGATSLLVWLERRRPGAVQAGALTSGPLSFGWVAASLLWLLRPLAVRSAAGFALLVLLGLTPVPTTVANGRAAWLARPRSGPIAERIGATAAVLALACTLPFGFDRWLDGELERATDAVLAVDGGSYRAAATLRLWRPISELGSIRAAFFDETTPERQVELAQLWRIRRRFAAAADSSLGRCMAAGGSPYDLTESASD